MEQFIALFVSSFQTSKAGPTTSRSLQVQSQVAVKTGELTFS
jgi:hypothetical protein